MIWGSAFIFASKCKHNIFALLLHLFCNCREYGKIKRHYVHIQNQMKVSETTPNYSFSIKFLALDSTFLIISLRSTCSYMCFISFSSQNFIRGRVWCFGIAAHATWLSWPPSSRPYCPSHGWRWDFASGRECDRFGILPGLGRHLPPNTVQGICERMWWYGKVWKVQLKNWDGFVVCCLVMHREFCPDLSVFCELVLCSVSGFRQRSQSWPPVQVSFGTESYWDTILSLDSLIDNSSDSDDEPDLPTGQGDSDDPSSIVNSSDRRLSSNKPQTCLRDCQWLVENGWKWTSKSSASKKFGWSAMGVEFSYDVGEWKSGGTRIYHTSVKGGAWGEISVPPASPVQVTFYGRGEAEGESGFNPANGKSYGAFRGSLTLGVKGGVNIVVGSIVVGLEGLVGSGRVLGTWVSGDVVPYYPQKRLSNIKEPNPTIPQSLNPTNHISGIQRV